MKIAYFYGVRLADSTQHLLERQEGVALCGAQSDRWHFAKMSTRPHPGLMLCNDCRSMRRFNEMQAELDAKEAKLSAERERIRTFWLDKPKSMMRYGAKPPTPRAR